MTTAISSPRRRTSAELTAPATEAEAEAAGLIHVTDADPGYRRVRAGRGFRYTDAEGRRLADPDALARIRALAIPPAWSDVWICPTPRGHIQATGRDQKGRKQYRYHAHWRRRRDATKYARMMAFARALDVIRDRTAADRALPGLPRRKVLAVVVRLLESTLIRVGNDEYARTNRSYGLTTFRDRHAAIQGATVSFRFRGKSGVEHSIDLNDRRLARVVRRCQELPGQQLLQYVDDDGQVCDIDSADVNDYLREITGQPFTAKDFRTWAGTVLAALALQEFAEFDTQKQARSNIVRAVESVARRLGNTPSVCRTCYIHPAILDAYLEGTTLATLRRAAAAMSAALHHLTPEEAAVLVLLQRRLAVEDAAAPPRRSRRRAASGKPTPSVRG